MWINREYLPSDKYYSYSYSQVLEFMNNSYFYSYRSWLCKSIPIPIRGKNAYSLIPELGNTDTVHRTKVNILVRGTTMSPACCRLSYPSGGWRLYGRQTTNFPGNRNLRNNYLYLHTQLVHKKFGDLKPNCHWRSPTIHWASETAVHNSLHDNHHHLHDHNEDRLTKKSGPTSSYCGWPCFLLLLLNDIGQVLRHYKEFWGVF